MQSGFTSQHKEIVTRDRASLCDMLPQDLSPSGLARSSGAHNKVPCTGSHLSLRLTPRKGVRRGQSGLVNASDYARDTTGAVLFPRLYHVRRHQITVTVLMVCRCTRSSTESFAGLQNPPQSRTFDCHTPARSDDGREQNRQLIPNLHIGKKCCCFTATTAMQCTCAIPTTTTWAWTAHC